MIQATIFFLSFWNIGNASNVYWIQGIPGSVTKQQMRQLLQSPPISLKAGEDYDFFYLSLRFRTGENMHHAAIGLVNDETFDILQSKFSQYGLMVGNTSFPNLMIGGDIKHRNSDQLIEYFRDSPIMHEVVPEEYQPWVFSASNKSKLIDNNHKVDLHSRQRQHCS